MLCCIGLQLLIPTLSVDAQTQTPTPDPRTFANEKAQELLTRMTPEERVGQLFLVTFNGSDAGQGTDIYDLITNGYIGGVILQSSNDNFTNDSQTIKNAIGLTRQLQTNRRDASRESRTNPSNGESFVPAYVPLFIGISQEGDGYPFDQIIDGITVLPNQMALGASWNPELAGQTGALLGQQMTSVGINLILGPSLDVLETPHTEGASDLGTRTFGGDPFWVGKLGQSYIQGLHAGGNGRLAVIATHFPGYGGSDRLPEDEVATVRKSLDQLLGFELTPFLAVTGLAPSTEATADGLLTAHIRYQGFQGNIRATTRPVSFDPQALSLLLDLPEFGVWRQNGGVMVSDNLGSRAVRGFYDLTSQSFDMPRRVALNAFLAGNDLLYVGDFSSGDLNSIESARRTLEFFSQKYREDPAFAQRVDESVLRILALKYRVYEDFILDNVLASPNPDPALDAVSPMPFSVAQQGATLISPTQAELDETIPDPPNQNDRIVFLTDTRTGAQCSTCPEEPLISERALEQSILRLYGPQAGGQVTNANMISYNLVDLQQMLDQESGGAQLERSLSRANWIVFSMLDSSNRVPSYQTLSRFLTERPDLFQKKRLIVFAFNAPYFLDATNISKLTAYYGLYSKGPAFLDMAAYLLFQEQRATGASPVSIPGISYDLSIALFPDPNQVFSLELDFPAAEADLTGGTPEPKPPPVFHIGDNIPIRTTIILDQNGNPTPDGTPVEFSFVSASQSTPVRQIQTTTNGVARTAFTISETGRLEIEAVSEPAKSSVLTLEIPSPNPGETVQATEAPTDTPSPTPTATENPADVAVLPVEPPIKPNMGDWFMTLLIATGLAWVSYKYTSNIRSVPWGVRTGLLVLLGGLGAYTYLALRLPGTEILIGQSTAQGVFLATLAGACLGLLIAWGWQAALKKGKS